MEPGQPLLLLTNMVRTKLLSLLSTPDRFPNHERIIGSVQRIVEEQPISVVHEVNCRNLAVEEGRAQGVREENGVQDFVVEDLGGKITTSPKDSEMHLFKSNLTGSYSRKLNLISYRKCLSARRLKERTCTIVCILLN